MSGIAHAVGTLMLLGLLACGGKLVDEQPFTDSGERLTLSWETNVPEGEPSLWLDYALHTASESIVGGERQPVYRLDGSLRVTTSGNAVYDGRLLLSDEGATTTSSGSAVRLGSRQTCNAKGCDISGRIRVLLLDELSAGSPLVIEASMPRAQGDAEVQGLTMQLRSK